MKKNTWFDEVFLPSLYSRAMERTDRKVWLSEKQRLVCERNMKFVKSNFFMTQYGTSKQYTDVVYEWNGRRVSLAPAREGCGVLWFSKTEEELVETGERLEKQRLEDPRERELDIKKLTRKLESSKKEVEAMLEETGFSDWEYLEEVKSDILEYEKKIAIVSAM